MVSAHPPESPDSLMAKIRRIKMRTWRTLPFVFLVLSMLIYQIQWFSATDNISISYDFSNLEGIRSEFTPQDSQNGGLGELDLEGIDQLSTQGGNLENLIVLFIEVLAENSTDEAFNLTQAANFVIQTSNFSIPTIEALLGISINDLYDLYENLEEIGTNLLLAFFREIWLYALENLIPDSWLQPGNITIINNAWMKLEDITIEGSFLLENEPIPFIEYVDIDIPAQSEALLNLSLRDIFSGFINMSMEALSNITLDDFKSFFNTTLEYGLKPFSYYMGKLFGLFNIGAQIYFNAQMGLFSMNLKFSMDFTQVAKNIEKYGIDL